VLQIQQHALQSTLWARVDGLGVDPPSYFEPPPQFIQF